MCKLALLLCVSILASGCRGKSDWAEVFIKKGAEYFKQGKYEKSLEEFLKAQHLSPSDERIYEEMAKIHLQMENHGAALENLNKIVLLNPNCKPSIYVMKADLYSAGNIHTREAINGGYTPAIQRDPTQGIYFYKRGLAYQKLGETDNANADFDSARKLGYKV